jgi:hypothetical protein
VVQELGAGRDAIAAFRQSLLEPFLFPGDTGLVDRDAGDRQDLQCQEHPKPGVLPETP